MNYPIEISRRTINPIRTYLAVIFLIGVGLTFSIVGYWMYIDNYGVLGGLFPSAFCFALGLFMIVFIIAASVFKPNINSPVLIICPNGITINKTVKIGPIAWEDIKSVNYFNNPAPNSYGLQRVKGMRVKINNHKKYVALAKQNNDGKFLNFRLFALTSLPYGRIMIGDAEVEANIQDVSALMTSLHQQNTSRPKPVRVKPQGERLFS